MNFYILLAMSFVSITMYPSSRIRLYHPENLYQY
jgi:hypothetical protein